VLKRLIRGNEKIMLDLIFSKMVIANTVKVSCFYYVRRE
jgi:hypothetical protein